MGGPNFIRLNPFLQYSDGTFAGEPDVAETMFQVPGIIAPVDEGNKTFEGLYYEEYSQFLLHTLDDGYTIAGLTKIMSIFITSGSYTQIQMVLNSGTGHWRMLKDTGIQLIRPMMAVI